MEKPTGLRIPLTGEMLYESINTYPKLIESFMSNEKNKKIYDEIEKACKAEGRTVTFSAILEEVIQVLDIEKGENEYLELHTNLYMDITASPTEKDLDKYIVASYKVDSTSPNYSPYDEVPIIYDRFSDELKQAINKLYTDKE